MALQELATRMRRASTTPPDGETLPWSDSCDGPVAPVAPPRSRRRLAGPILLGSALFCGSIAAWRFGALIAEPHWRESLRAPLLLQGLGAASLCAVLLLGLTAWQWRRQRVTGQALRKSADHLRRGSWESAVDHLRKPEQRVPSAFGDLAAQVEGVVGESERRWQARAELSADWYWETDERDRLSWLSADSPLVRPAGRALADLLGRRHDQLGFMRPPEGGWDAFHDRIERQETFRGIEVMVDGLGQRTSGWVALSGRPRWRRDGRFAGYEGVGTDISDRKAAFQRLQASEQRYAVMAGLSSDWYWFTDEQHRYPPPDNEMLRRFGDLARRMEGHTCWELYADALPAAQWQAHRDDLAARLPFRALEFPVRRDDGCTVWVSLAGAPHLTDDGRFMGYHGVGRDITLRKMTEQMLVKHNRELQLAVTARTRELEMANRDLDNFAQQLAHELRTPISQVQSLADLLGMRLADRLQPDEATLLDLQRRAATDMLAALQALLELARSSADATQRQTVDLSALAHEVIGELPFIERNAPVAWDIQPGLEAWVSPPQMRIVLTNLLGNAAKFTRRTDRPVVGFTGAIDTEGLVTLKVADNGAGFDDSRAERLFQPFQRLHRQDEYQGTGIGLTIVQRIIQRHGGHISASGIPGRGATFEFTLGQRAR